METALQFILVLSTICVWKSVQLCGCNLLSSFLALLETFLQG